MCSFVEYETFVFKFIPTMVEANCLFSGDRDGLCVKFLAAMVFEDHGLTTGISLHWRLHGG